MSGNSPTAREGLDAGSRLAWSLPFLLGLALFAKIVSAPPTRSRPVPSSSPEARERFGHQVRPILESRCFGCHAELAEGKLRLDSRAAILAGGKSGPAAVPGDAASSLLLQVIGYQHEIKMPPDSALPPDDVAQIARWIDEGLVWPEAEGPLSQPYVISEAHRSHWAFQPLAAPTPETVGRYPEANAIDRFLLAKLEAEGLRPAPLAGKRALIRRVTYDLTGLPPTPGEVEAFVATDSPQAYAELVDRLLASPAYGERWGRHWLDVVRYADTAGDAGDFPVPEAYKYRNYVIDAFQHDKPYDQFVREQIAGDLLHASDDQERWEGTVATGYLAIARRIGVQPLDQRHITLEDAIDNLGKTFLGLTIQCARCHDHKFDPIPTSDYYALYGILDSSVFPHPGAEHAPYRRGFVYRVGRKQAQRSMASYEKEIARWDAQERKKFSEYMSFEFRLITTPGRTRETVWAELQAIRAQRAAVARTEPPLETAYAVQEGDSRDSAIHLAGDPSARGPLVRRGFLQILGGAQVPPYYRGSGRLLLADWIADPGNPLTARVMANRIWHHHFGAGLVRTTSDFGTRGELPTHPALLDYLARRFIESGWSVKTLHRLILHSRAYRQASADLPENHQRDPENRLLWRSHLRRLDAEQVRDSILAFSGELNRTRGYRHPFPHRRTYFYRQHEPFAEFFPSRRRSVYLMQPRIQKHPYLDLFDGPDGNLPFSERKATTTTLQALFLMNSSFMHEQASATAERWSAATPGLSAFFEKASRTIFGRPPRSGELERASAYLARAAGDEGTKRAGILRAMLASNEFLYVE